MNYHVFFLSDLVPLSTFLLFFVFLLAIVMALVLENKNAIIKFFKELFNVSV